MPTAIPNREINSVVPPSQSSSCQSDDDFCFYPTWKLIIFILAIAVTLLFGIVFLYCVYKKKSSKGGKSDSRDTNANPKQAIESTEPQYSRQHLPLYSVSPERGL